jgi:GNAT superfamily N-acetyltransferase
MEGVPIRNARRGDIPSLLLLWEAMMKEHAALDPRLAAHPRAREHMANQFSKWVSDPDRHLVVAEEGGRLVVGFASAVLAEGNGWQIPERLARITDCFVIRPRRRRGIGRRLTGRLLDLLYEQGLDTVRLATAEANEGAHAFWESMGWADLEEVMEREIPEADSRP